MPLAAGLDNLLKEQYRHFAAMLREPGLHSLEKKWSHIGNTSTIGARVCPCLVLLLWLRLSARGCTPMDENRRGKLSL